MKETMNHILALKNASLEDPIAKLDDAALERLRNPPREPVVIDSPNIWHSISSYFALEHASELIYVPALALRLSATRRWVSGDSTF
ncbi:hypothetical protein C8R48DRAFT_697807 [Suillus tomentosus]|nr:hypothetical protein C8R48DRAFT_697807 [Suillus tomentosus]